MTFDEFRNTLNAKAVEMGCSACEIYCSESKSFSVEILDGNIDKYKVANDISLSLRVVYDGHDGFASTEIFENPIELIKSAIDNARSVSTMDDHPMQGKAEYKKVEMQAQPYAKLSERECIEVAKLLERKALEKDSRVKRTTGSTVFVDKNKITLANDKGLYATHESEMSGVALSVVIEENGEEKVSGEYYFGKSSDNLDNIVEEVVNDGLQKLYASPVESGEYSVLFTNKGFANMLELFCGIFSADAAQKGLSQLAGKEGEMIASDCVTLCDDPFNSIYPIPFDYEGVPTQTKNVIENGKLITLLHSLKTAKKAGTVSTGNGTRTGTCEPTNFYIKPGEKSFSQLVKGEKVLVISELDGAGTGVNEVSGEFSLSARGQLYENGERVRAVNQITVAGTFFDLLKNIKAVGNDLNFTEMCGMGVIGSPCVLVEKLIVAGC